MHSRLAEPQQRPGSRGAELAEMLVVVRGSSDPLAAVLVRRAMGTVAKGTSRAAVHGSHSPTNTTVEVTYTTWPWPGARTDLCLSLCHGLRRPSVQGRDEAEEAIEKGKEEKRKAREQVEAKVDSRIGSSSASPHGKSAK